MRRAPYKRKDRLASQIKKAVSEIIEFESGNEKLKSITLTDVEVSGDLRIATIFVSSSVGGLSPKEALDVLDKAKGFIRKSLAERIRVRYMPQIRFQYDASIDYGFKIDEILKEIKDDEEGG
ncbi:30S ribosome-binding factor RbfA [Hippea jasoniae]|uniref:30S ribosome-binding factor RbfA n=1 Tax=Hippea jasoniae TaxID=944479 RepID=UPI00054F4A2D|nr:30S ribosome-binding factor RbfA [Hippea jasoniae]